MVTAELNNLEGLTWPRGRHVGSWEKLFIYVNPDVFHGRACTILRSVPQLSLHVRREAFSLGQRQNPYLACDLFRAPDR
jgi:hypothetical protein